MRLPPHRKPLRASWIEPLESRRLLTTYLVSSWGDVNDGNYGEGELSFREAVELSNAEPGEDTIRFRTGVGASLAQDLTVTDDLIIEGINENGERTGFDLQSGEATAGDLIIDDGDDDHTISVTIDGATSRGSYLSVPIMIVSRENLTVLNSTLDGGDWQYLGFSTGLEHTATTPDSYLIVRTSAFRRIGGHPAISSTGAATVTIESCEFSDNTAGAISIVGALEVAVVNSTLSGNHVHHGAGGLWLDLPSGEALVSNCTIFENSTNLSSGPAAGGIAVAAGTLRLNSSIVVGNMFADAPAEIALADGAALDLDGSADNLILDAATAGGLQDGVNGNIVGQIARLAPLAENGGPTLTHALLADSPALDAGNNELGLETDQRGWVFGRSERAPDIGAYEARTFAFVVDSLSDEFDEDLSPGDLTLREALTITGANPGTETISFSDQLLGSTILLTDYLTIADDTVIQGPGADQLTLDAGGQHSHFFIQDDSHDTPSLTATISGLRLINSPGAISSSERLVLDRVEIEDCAGFRGSAIRSSGPLTVTDSVFRRNAASVEGGAIYTTAAATISGSLFIANTTPGDGGAIWAEAALTLSACTFDGNASQGHGGAVFLRTGSRGSLTIESSSFSGNSARRGGAVSAEQAALSVSDSTFDGNTAEEDGGAIAGAGTFTDSQFDGNTAGHFGGAIASRGEAAIRGCSFRSNAADESGGGIWALHDVSLAGAILVHNTAQFGGAVRTYERLTTESSLFESNEAVNDGGAVQCGGGSVQGSTFRLNTAGGEGGAILNSWLLFVESSTFAENTALRGGAILNRSSLSVARSTFSANVASGAGGAIFNDHGSAEIESSALDGNTAGTDGGAIWTNGSFFLINSTASGNAADGLGGAIAITDAEATIRFSTIAFNIADADGAGGGSGGGVFVGAHTGAGTLTTENSIYAANTARGALNALDAVNAGQFSDSSSHNLIDDPIHSGGLVHGENGNIVGVDPLLRPLADNGGPTATHALRPGSPAIDSAVNPRSTDQRGAPRPAGEAPDIGAFESSTLGAAGEALPDTVSAAPDVHQIVVWSIEDDWIVFRGQGEQWTAERLGGEPNTGAVVGNAVTWTDPADGLTRVAGPTSAGFVVYTRDAAGAWSVADIAADLGVQADAPTRALTQLTTRRGLAVVAGYSAAGEIVAFRQVFRSGGKEWIFVNISDDLAAQGMATPELAELVGFVTPWDAWNLAGIDDSGQIQAVWLHPSSFTSWRVDNLSAITGAPPLVGSLSVTQTSWLAINLGGLNGEGRLLVTWWVPGFGSEWVTSDLTSAAGGPRLSPGPLTGFVTPWGAINYAGLDSEGRVIAYWWTTGSDWTASTLLGAAQAPTHALNSHVSAGGSISIVGINDARELLRLWWAPGGDDLWRLTNLSRVASGG